MILPKGARKHRIVTLAVVSEVVDGKRRYKISGYYVRGKRVRKYFPTRGKAETFLRLELTRKHNLGARAARIDGALAEDALRAADALNTTPFNLLDAARIVAKGHARLSPHSISIEEAIERQAAETERRQQSISVTELAEMVIANRRAKGRRLSHIRDLETRLRRFAGTFGNSIVAVLTAQEIDRWIQSLKVGPQSQNNFRTVLGAMWNFALRHGYAAVNVIKDIEKASVDRDSIPTFTVDQLARLLAAAPLEYLPVLAIGAFAGVRPEEINRLRWEDIDFEEGTIQVNASVAKTRKKRFAEIPANLAAWLRPYAGRVGPVGPPNLQKLRLATMAAADIKRWPQDVLRHSFASAHYAFHKNPAHTALLLGHSDQNMLLTHYRNLMKPSEAGRYWKLAPNAAEISKIVPIQAR